MKIVGKNFNRFNPISFLLILAVFLTLFISYFHLITAITQDLGRHLLTGQIIFESRSIPKTNLFSYTFPDFPFINHHWLSEVIFYILHLISGFTGLLLSMTFLVITTFLLLFLKIRKIVNVESITLVFILLMRVLFERTDLRPELFSFLFLGLLLVILYSYKERFTRLIFLIPVIQLLWVNMHIYFIVGIFVLGLFLIDLLIQTKFKIVKQKDKIYLFVFFLCCIATLFNPNGINGALYPINFLSNYGYTIEENQNIFFLQSYFPKPSILFFEISVLLLFTTLLIARKTTSTIDWLLAFFFTILGATAIRNFPLFAIAVFIPFCKVVDYSLKRFKILIPNQKKSIFMILSYFLLFSLLFLQIKSSLNRYPFTSRLDNGGGNAVTFFQKNKLEGPIFNNFDIGSYLEYRLYPKEKVFIDGRPEAYPHSFIQNIYIPMQMDKTVFQTVEKKYGFKTILFSHTDQTPWAEEFLRWISQDEQWKIIYLDESMVILQKNILNKTISDDPQMINAYSKSLPSLLKLAHFYSIVGWIESQKKTLQAILIHDPKHCPALYNLALISQKENDPSQPLYINQYLSNCK